MVGMAGRNNLLVNWTNFCCSRDLCRGVVSMRTLTDFPYSNVLVLGLAKSGTAAAKLLLESQIKVRVNDSQTNEKNVHELIEMGADVVIGSHPLSVLDGIELI